ncbi:hypothetical protein AALB39_04100 [Lachnospiraceae bacterium 54-53]
MEDRLIIGISSPDEITDNGDVPVLTVMRLSGDKRSVLKSFAGQAALDVHKFLTESKPNVSIL